MKNLRNKFLETTILEAEYKINGKNAAWKQDAAGIFVGLDPNSPLSYGGAILTQLKSALGRNYSVSVKDFGPQILVDVEYTNVKTCRSASLSFLIVLTSKEGDGFVKSSSIRYRSIGNVNQAVTYILSRKEELKSKTENA